eukprot:18389-Pelagococcus_subviridis.AAC.6
MLDDVAQLGRAREDLRRDLLHELRALFLAVRLVVLRQPDLALPAEQQREVNHDAPRAPRRVNERPGRVLP